MTDIKLFSLDGEGLARAVPESPRMLEKSIQNLIEQNIGVLLGIRLLGTEYSTGRKHGGRIDTLGIDENARPVIIEYKRSTNQNVINQGLFYLDWLLDHQAEFKQLVQDKLGVDVAGAIDWSKPRLICIAGGFTRYDNHAVQQMSRNIELVCYRRFSGDLLMLELVSATRPESGASSGSTAKGNRTGDTGGAKTAAKGKASGARIRELLIAGKLDTAGILKVIHKEYPKSKAAGSDVSWNRWQLKKFPEKYDAKTGDSLRQLKRGKPSASTASETQNSGREF